MFKKSCKASLQVAAAALSPLHGMESTCVAIREMGGDDLLLGAISVLLEPCDLHHLFVLVHLVATGKPGLALGQGALGCDGLHWLHKDGLGT